MLRTTQELQDEPRYDAATLRKVTVLAERLKAQHQESYSAREMEAIGAEVGLEPGFMREALAQLRRPLAGQELSGPGLRRPPLSQNQLAGLTKAWWSAAWVLPFLLTLAVGAAAGDKPAAGLFFFLGWAIYIGAGVYMSHVSGLDLEGSGPKETAPVQRQALLDALFTLQHHLESTRQRRVFLSVDVVGSTELKRGASELAVEYSFGQFREWVQAIVQGRGGEMQSAAGDGMMAVFADEAAALRAARQIQESLVRFNAATNQLSLPFRVRCGLSAGEVAVEPGTPIGHLNSPVIDRAAYLQKRAAPGDIVVGSELAATALVELGRVAPLESDGGEPVFSWLAGRNLLPAGPA